MTELLLFVGMAVAAVAFMVAWARRAASRNRADKDAVTRTRLTGEGGGWLYEYGWPRRKRPPKDR